MKVPADVTSFRPVKLDYPIIADRPTPSMAKGLSKNPLQSHQRSAQATLVALKEFKRYLESLEKDLSRISKKYSKREIAQGVGFVAAGIHEALNYLAIVRKVIEKTERAIAKKNAVGEGVSLSAGSS